MPGFATPAGADNIPPLASAANLWHYVQVKFRLPGIPLIHPRRGSNDTHTNTTVNHLDRVLLVWRAPRRAEGLRFRNELQCESDASRLRLGPADRGRSEFAERRADGDILRQQRVVGNRARGLIEALCRGLQTR